MCAIFLLFSGATVYNSYFCIILLCYDYYVQQKNPDLQQQLLHTHSRQIVQGVITWMGTLLIATLVAVLVLRKCLNKLHSAEQTQQERGQDGMYVIVESGKPAEAVDNETEEVNTSQNPIITVITHT